MPRRCRVCDHPQRGEIDELLVGHSTHNRRIAAQHGLSEASVRRHAQHHLPAALALAQQAKGRAQAENLQGKLATIERTALRLSKKAEAKGDVRTAGLLAVRELTRIAELAARARGELQTAGLLRSGSRVSLAIRESPEFEEAVEERALAFVAEWVRTQSGPLRSMNLADLQQRRQASFAVAEAKYEAHWRRVAPWTMEPEAAAEPRMEEMTSTSADGDDPGWTIEAEDASWSLYLPEDTDVDELQRNWPTGDERPKRSEDKR